MKNSETIKNIAVNPDETIISLDVKSLYTNDLLKEAIKFASCASWSYPEFSLIFLGEGRGGNGTFAKIRIGHVILKFIAETEIRSQ